MPRTSKKRLLNGSLALSIPILLALVVSLGADHNRFLAMVMLAEPILLGLALYIIAALLLRRRWRMGLSTSVGVVVSVFVMHDPIHTIPAPELQLPATATVSGCLEQADLPTAPLRAVSWRLSGTSTASAMDYLLAMRPDVAVLGAMKDNAILEGLVEHFGGEAKHFGVPGDLMGVWVHGSFTSCGDETDTWVLSRSAPGTNKAKDHRLSSRYNPINPLEITVLLFPRVAGVGVFPMLALQVPMDFSRDAPQPWPEPQKRAAAAMAAATRLAGNAMVVAGHLAAPPNLRRVSGLLNGAGLSDSGGPPTWPGRLWGLPFPSFQRLDRIIVGGFWEPDYADAPPGDGHYPAVLVKLQPASQPETANSPGR